MLIKNMHSKVVAYFFSQIESIATRSRSFGMQCLTEYQVDFFVTILIKRYSMLLHGVMAELPVVDISKCIAKDRDQNIAHICQGTIEKCWS